MQENGKLVSSNQNSMSHPEMTYHIYSIGDSAITVDFGNTIQEAINREVLNRFHYLKQHPLYGMVEVAPAYSSFTIYYDMQTIRKKYPDDNTAFAWMKKQTEDFLRQPVPENEFPDRLVKIPVCYATEMAPDIRQTALTNNISVEEVISIHTSVTYRVFMLGFLPGFAYMGEVEESISVPRKTQPENVAAGSVGIAGKQTGVYPMASPGGWQIIGRTPVKLFDKEKEDPALLKAGDRVQFYAISKNEFYEKQNPG